MNVSAQPDGDAAHGRDLQFADAISMVLAVLTDVAPEQEPKVATLPRDVDLWTELQLDSMDHLAVMTRLSDRTGREIPEHEYPRLTTIDALAGYLVTNQPPRERRT